MNPGFYLAGKFTTGEGAGHSRVAKPVLLIARAGIALGTTVMILAMAIVTGFKKEIREKATGFSGDMQVLPIDLNNSFEKQPIDTAIPQLTRALHILPEGTSITPFATKAGIIKTKDEIEGIVLKGFGPAWNHGFFKQYLKSGHLVTFEDAEPSLQILISAVTAKRINLKVGDSFLVYFAQQPPRARKFTIAGIFDTGLEEMDKTYAICDIRHIQKLSDWNSSSAAGIQIHLPPGKEEDVEKERLRPQLPFNLDVLTIRELNPQLFDWLGLQDINSLIMIILLAAVTSINMIAALFVMIIERSHTIGILKAMGAGNALIRRIFFLVALRLLGTGLLAGNVLGLLLCWLQKKFSLVSLDQATYYISRVPIRLEPLNLMYLNIFIILICGLALILHTRAIIRVSPMQAIAFK